MNYYLHNVNYDKSISFRRIMLQTYKDHCMWLRDYPIDSIGLYDYTKWLPDMSYEQSNLEHAKESYKKAKLKIASLTKEKLQDLYAEELRKYEVLHNSKNSYYAELVAKIKLCAEEYRTHLEKWNAIQDTPNWLTEDLIDIYDTAIKEMMECTAKDIEEVKRMHSKTPPTFEEFAKKELKRLEADISFFADRIKSAKHAIKRITEECKEVKQMFTWLDSIEKEEYYNGQTI